MITPRNILRHEIIGLRCTVMESSNKKQEGIGGIVVNETKNMITIEKKGDALKITKPDAEFIFTLPDGKKVKIRGTMLVARPENRIKMKLRKW